MSEDLIQGEASQLQKRVWRNKVPLCFCMASHETTDPSVLPYFVLASRFSYLPVVAQPAIQKFKQLAVVFGKVVRSMNVFPVVGYVN